MTKNALQAATKRLCLTGVAAALCTLATSGAIADSFNEPMRRTVSYAELDLSKQAGVEVLYRRIKDAARIVCGGRDPIVRISLARSQCYEKAVADAVAQVNSPLLTALHTKKTTRLAKK